MRAAEKHIQDTVVDGTKWFADHEAKVMHENKETNFLHVRWKKPGSSTYWMDLFVTYDSLMVRGDLGEAIYCWHGRVTPEFLLDCELDYFMGKCEASEKGRKPTDWIKAVALEWLDEQKRYMLECCDGDLSKEESERFDEVCDELRALADSKQGWLNYVNEHYHDEIQEAFGDDAWESGVFSAGEVVDVHNILHWHGMKLAFKALGYGA